MPTALSYPGLRCVLEFLIPMKSDGLGFTNGRGKCFERIYPSNLKPEEAMKKLLNSYLGVRSKIYVKCFFFNREIPKFVPPNLILQINELRCCFSYIDGFLPIIDPSSFPLKTLRTAICELTNLNHPVLTSAQELIVLYGFDGLTQLIKHNNTNKRVTFEKYNFRPIDLLVLIENWKKNGKEIGTIFKFHDYKDNLYMHYLLRELKEFKIESDHHSQVTPILKVPIDAFAEIHVSQDNEDYIVVEVVSSKNEIDATEVQGSSKKERKS
ncbi:hypothetical protein GCK72_008028 [Caenorhabditis remanei]|uniref:F-box associated domain-containing protein n=1 Tax=Caenorhabditis remanei TaxID=31234 RepID=A0A6A5HP28_CAERE|nr:hypothetical protein GCK72_008028 [Caenorhabditis remanei]KAF1768067.1 hypothetical protein GCK72_008028 [Caenorhabditis remanei]